MKWPTEFRINAWANLDNEVTSQVSPSSKQWLRKDAIHAPYQDLIPPPEPDEADWRNSQIGWGLILPENKNISEPERARGVDAPLPIRELLDDRQDMPVLRFDSRLWQSKHMLIRYYADGSDAQGLSLRGGKRGIGRGCLPYYLLIYGTPEEIPWEVQYVLNIDAFVGRLDLQGEALENYIRALLCDWSEAACSARQAVVWAVDHGASDITHLMRGTIASKIYQSLASDADIDAHYINGSRMEASNAALIQALSQNQPALIITTSHGMTSPLNDRQRMKEQLGLPVDCFYRPLDLQDLLGRWQPNGAIWYAHACCSAGGDTVNRYDGLVQIGSYVDHILQGVASLGATTAPLPRTLLGMRNPLRAFIGHVEPTFDWTLRHESTKEVLTNSIQQALYSQLYRRKPVGLAFKSHYAKLGGLFSMHQKAFQRFQKGADTLEEMLTCQLTAQDRESLVLLGDPTVVLPAFMSTS